MGFIEEWFDSRSRPTLVKRTFSQDNLAYVECTVVKNTSVNWSFIFTVSKKVGASPKVEVGSWTISKANFNTRSTIEAQIENAYNEIESVIVDGTDGQEVETFEESSEVVREETVGGVTITMTRTENTLDLRGGEDAVYYKVSNTSPNNTPTIFDTQEEAEEKFDYQVNFYTPRPVTSTLYEVEYRGVNIRFQDTNMSDGTDFISEKTNQSMDSVFLSGEITEEFPLGSDVSLRDGYGLQEFGTITGDEESDLQILEAYIDARLDGREDPNPPESPPQFGELPIYSWGWYDANENERNPFEKVYLENVFTVSGTDGRILVLQDDDFIAQGFQSGLAKLRVKRGYRVELKVMIQEKGYLDDYLPNASNYGFETYGEADDTEQRTNYIDTEKVSIMLEGGDSLEINIDGLDIDPSVDNFKIIQNGQLITRGSAPKINRETFLAITYVERLPQIEDDDEGGSGDDVITSTSTGSAIPILVGGALILTILYMVLARGGEE